VRWPCISSTYAKASVDAARLRWSVEEPMLIEPSDLAIFYRR
jgi:hypothetical protein